MGMAIDFKGMYLMPIARGNMFITRRMAYHMRGKILTMIGY